MELNKYIDHTNLKNTSTLKDIEKLCDGSYQISGKITGVMVLPDDITLEDVDYSFESVIEEKVFILGTVCTVSETMAWKNSGGFIASLDENGMFVDLTLMED